MHFMTATKPLSQKLFWIGLLCCHFIVLAFLYFKFGFNTLNEGDKYLTRANFFAHGDFVNSTQYQTFYIAYVVYLSVFIFLKIPTLLIFLSTYLISLFAYYKFHQLISTYINNQTAKLWLIFVCLSPLVQYWQFNLFSETFFNSVGNYFMSNKMYDKAEVLFQTSMEKYPQSLNVYTRMSAFYKATGDKVKEEEFKKQAQAIKTTYQQRGITGNDILPDTIYNTQVTNPVCLEKNCPTILLENNRRQSN